MNEEKIVTEELLLKDFEEKDKYIDALDVVRYFELTFFGTIQYRFYRVIYWRQEDYLARRLLDRMKSLTPLDNFSRGGLLGMLDAWDIAGEMSPLMFAMLSIRVQDDKYHKQEFE